MDDPWIRRARLERVVDGDTYRVTLDLGYATYARHSVRLLGVDTPELFSGPPASRARGQAAKDFAVAWFAAHADHTDDPEWPLIVRSEKDAQTFGRYVGDVRCRAGHALAGDVLAAGHGVLI